MYIGKKIIKLSENAVFHLYLKKKKKKLNMICDLLYVLVDFREIITVSVWLRSRLLLT